MIDQEKLRSDILREAATLWPEEGKEADDHEQANEYSIQDLEDFIKLDGKAFVINAYKLLLGRLPEENGLNHYSNALTHGKLTKPLILGRLRFSREGRTMAVIVPNLLPTFIWHLFFLVPVFGRFFGLMNRLFDINTLHREIRQTYSKIKEREKKILELNSAAETHEQRINQLEELVIPPKMGDLYLEFENRFRGTPTAIKQGMLPYLPFAVNVMKETDSKAVDLGCGRCDWLELLHDKEGIRSIGVDSNEALLNLTRDNELQLVIADIFTWFTTIDNDSFSLVTSFHLIEHLPFPLQLRMLDEIFRILKPGGITIIESPNTRNIMVGAGDFFRDPTHIRPIFPDTLNFLGLMQGFINSSIFFFTPNKEALLPIESVPFDTINDYINVSRDFCWMGTKP